RFGKSLLINTIEELFFGNRDLFEGCWIYDKWNWEERTPVIKISFSEIGYRKDGLEQALEYWLSGQAELHGVRLEAPSYDRQFLELLEKVGGKTPAAVLIDEYDKPIIDYLERSEFTKALENREILKTFYTGVKDQDKYLRFFFMTGVSKFSKVSIFSDLNHLTDITISKHFAAITGYTEAEIKHFYREHLNFLCQELGQAEDDMMRDIARWYNGYSWDGKTFVFNPYSIISLFFHQVFRNYWFETGSPTFLIKKMKEDGKKINASIHKKVNESAFNKYDIEDINSTAIMFQTGYLTIKEFDPLLNKYRLDFPNKEVCDSFLNFAAEHYAGASQDEMGGIVEMLREALEQNDVQSFFISLQALFSSIAVRQLDKVKEYEGFYHSVIYITLKILGIHVACEVQSHFGTTDAVIQTDEYIYVVEFKMGSAHSALEQIKKKKYHAPFLADRREVVLIGFGFDKAERNLTEFLVENILKTSQRERQI
ncbi:MAG: AAA family ATPase, partial [Candidatus Electrothrix sp. AR1]|nr:AAA family ATPase [Candidatus Electrothrix sp. AR1]